LRFFAGWITTCRLAEGTPSAASSSPHTICRLPVLSSSSSNGCRRLLYLARSFTGTIPERRNLACVVRNGTWMCPTLSVLRAAALGGEADLRNDPRMKYVPKFLKEQFWKDAYGWEGRSAEDSARAKRVYQKQLEVVGMMRRAGVRFIAGTDTANPYVFPGFSLHEELALLVEAGFTPMQALQSATRDAADYLGLLDSVGTIEKGKAADLVLLDADPLAEIGATRKINAVVLGGRLIPRQELDKMLAGVEAAVAGG
jgi:hypothetical protein